MYNANAVENLVFLLDIAKYACEAREEKQTLMKPLSETKPWSNPHSLKTVVFPYMYLWMFGEGRMCSCYSFCSLRE